MLFRCSMKIPPPRRENASKGSENVFKNPNTVSLLGRKLYKTVKWLYSWPKDKGLQDWMPNVYELLFDFETKFVDQIVQNSAMQQSMELAHNFVAMAFNSSCKFGPITSLIILHIGHVRSCLRACWNGREELLHRNVSLIHPC